MITFIRTAIASLVLAASLAAADAPADAATTPATPATPAAAPPATVAAAVAKVAFGAVTVASDHKSLTMVDAKGAPLKLTITDATTITIDLKKAAIGDISSTATVRVTYTGDVAEAIDQLKPDKKKKKKTV